MLAGSAVVTEAEGLASSDNDTSLPTTAAVIDYVTSAVAAENELSEMNDVVITSVTDNEVLAYDSTTSKWINQTAAEAGLATASNLTSHTGNTSNPHSVTKTQVGLGNVENTALSTWAGTTNITTLGTITTGTWNGTAVADGYISSASNWNTAYGWGNHASAGYAVASNNLSDLTNTTTALTNLGFTSTITELNYTDGVTSNIQTQINASNANALAFAIALG